MITSRAVATGCRSRVLCSGSKIDSKICMSKRKIVKTVITFRERVQISVGIPMNGNGPDQFSDSSEISTNL